MPVLVIVELASQEGGELQDSHGNVLADHEIFVYVRGSYPDAPEEVQLYTDATGETELAQPVTTTILGAIPGYAAAGQSVDFFDATTGALEPAELVAGSGAVNAAGAPAGSSPIADGSGGTTWAPLAGVSFQGAYASGRTYSTGQAVSASDGHNYISLVDGNIGHNPVTDGGVHWSDLAAPLAVGSGVSGATASTLLETDGSGKMRSGAPTASVESVRQDYASGAPGPTAPLANISRAYAAGLVPHSDSPLIALTGGPITDIWVANGFIYWADSASMYIGRANLDGTGANPTFCNTGAAALWSVCADASHLYWTDNTGRTIGRANVDGSSPNNAFIPGLAAGASGYYVRVNANNIFWSVYANAGAIGVAQLNGTVVTATLVSGCHAPHQLVVSAAGTDIYWSEDGSFAQEQLIDPGTVGHATLSGSGAGITASGANHSFLPASAIQASDGPTGIATDGTYLYWLDFGWPGLGGVPYHPRIGRALLNGTEVDPNFLILNQGLTAGVWPLALNNGIFYWSPNAGGAGIFSLDTSGGRPLPTHTDVGAAAAAAIAPYVAPNFSPAPAEIPMGIVPQIAGSTTYGGTSLSASAALNLYALPTYIPAPMDVNGVACAMGVSSGNFIVALFEPDGTGWALVAVSPSTAVAATSQGKFQVGGVNTPYRAKPGQYLKAIMFDNSTAKPNYQYCLSLCHGTGDAPVEGSFAMPSILTALTDTSGQFVPALILV